MPDFQGDDWIYLQPDTVKAAHAFAVSQCSSASANDGAIPYGFVPTTCTVVASDADGNDVTAQMIADDTPSVSASGTTYTVIVQLTYPAVAGDGRYTLELQWSDGTSTYCTDLERVYAGDRSA